jgi:predicted pyridoxine 5'-phosphate oxidase superfamily flavin-nucleotide-binding protein
MVTMPEELLHLLTEWHTVPIATVGPDGTPNVTPKSVMVMNPNTIVWGELYFMQTYENLKNNPHASICIWQRTPPFRAYRMNGTVTIHENDEVSARLDEAMRTGHPMVFKASREQLAAVWFSVEEIYDQTPGVETAGKKIA